MKKKGPWIVLLILFLILIFVVGVRYGQQVEKANKVIDFVISLTPSPPTQTPTPAPIEYKTYIGKQCATQFLYPSYIKLIKEASDSARFEQNNEVKIQYSCALKDPKYATDSAALVNKSFYNSLTGRTVYFNLEKGLLPLIERSITFKR